MEVIPRSGGQMSGGGKQSSYSCRWVAACHLLLCLTKRRVRHVNRYPLCRKVHMNMHGAIVRARAALASEVGVEAAVLSAG